MDVEFVRFWSEFKSIQASSFKSSSKIQLQQWMGAMGMTVEEFKKLVEETMDKSCGVGLATKLMSRPSGNLVDQYGPLTDKIAKQKSVDAALLIWQDFAVRQRNQPFLDAHRELSAEVSGMALQTTNAAVLSQGAISFLTTQFDATMKTVLEEVKETPSPMKGVLLTAMDMGITAGLALVPVVGPLLVPLSQGLTSALMVGVNRGLEGAGARDGVPMQINPTDAAHQRAFKDLKRTDDQIDAADSAGAASKTISSGVQAMLTADKDSWVGQLAAQKGIASLIVKGIELMVDKNYKDVLALADDPKARSFTNLMQSQLQTQNQGYAQAVNESPVTVPTDLKNVAERTDFYKDEKKTIADFKKKTSSVFRSYYGFIESVISHGITDSFKDSTKAFDGLKNVNTGGALSEADKVALLIMGYYYSKRWGLKIGLEKQVAANASRMSSALERMEKVRSELTVSQPDIAKARIEDQIKRLHGMCTIWRGERIALDAQLDALKTKAGTLAKADAFWADPAARSKFPTQYREFTTAKTALSANSFSGDAFMHGEMTIDKLPQISSSAKLYFRSLKSAMSSDVLSAMNASVQTLTDEDMLAMWRLYIGANLILNQFLQGQKVKEHSWKVTRGVRYAASKATAYSSAPDVKDYYIALLKKAGFIHEYHMWTGIVTKAEKHAMARTRKLRWGASPSDAERAMLFTFCCIVAFGLDVGKISMGFSSWAQAKMALGEICFELSTKMAER